MNIVFQIQRAFQRELLNEIDVLISILKVEMTLSSQAEKIVNQNSSFFFNKKQ